jgi:hypothetical protein
MGAGPGEAAALERPRCACEPERGGTFALVIPAMPPSRFAGWRLRLAAAAWLLVIAALVLLLGIHTSAPTRTERGAARWPAASKLPREAGRPTLLMAIHPLCPCTRASLDELNVVQNRFGGAVTSYALVLAPRELDASWGESEARRRAHEIPGLRVIEDVDGEEAARFALEASGHVALYQPDGRLAFRGGITLARGHAGQNGGRAAVEALLAGGSADTDSHPVYGCPIAERGAREATFGVPELPAFARGAAFERALARSCALCHRAGSRSF